MNIRQHPTTGAYQLDLSMDEMRALVQLVRIEMSNGFEHSYDTGRPAQDRVTVEAARVILDTLNDAY